MKKFLALFAFTIVISLTLTLKASAHASGTIFEVLTPKADQTLYGDRIPILFNVEDFQLVKEEDAKPAPGQGHILLWLDQDQINPENATKVTENSFIFSDVKYGAHKLNAELVTVDNKSLTPPQKISVNFKTEMLPSAESENISNSFDKRTALVILVVVALVILAAWWYTKDEDDEYLSEEKPKVKKTTRKSTSKNKSRKRK